MNGITMAIALIGSAGLACVLMWIGFVAPLRRERRERARWQEPPDIYIRWYKRVVSVVRRDDYEDAKRRESFVSYPGDASGSKLVLVRPIYTFSALEPREGETQSVPRFLNGNRADFRTATAGLSAEPAFDLFVPFAGNDILPFDQQLSKFVLESKPDEINRYLRGIRDKVGRKGV